MAFDVKCQRGILRGHCEKAYAQNKTVLKLYPKTPQHCGGTTPKKFIKLSENRFPIVTEITFSL